MAIDKSTHGKGKKNLKPTCKEKNQHMKIGKMSGKTVSDEHKLRGNGMSVLKREWITKDKYSFRM